MLSYRKGNSALHSLDARLKIPLLALFSLAIVFIRLPEVAFAGLVLNLLLLQESGIKMNEFWGQMKGILLFAAIPLPLQVIATGSIGLGMLNSLILANLLTASFLFVSTTRVGAISDGLAWFRMPKTLVFSIALAFSIIPLLQQELHDARVAQCVRGGSLRKPSSVLPMIIPLFHSVFARARGLSISLETRGFDPDGS